MGDIVMEVGGKSVSHSPANTLPFEGAVSHLRGSVMPWLSPERDGLRLAGCGKRRERR